MLKKTLLLIVLSASLLSGCITPITLSEQAIVQAVSLDKIDGKITVGLQIFSPSKSGEGKIGASADNAKIIEATGDTISQAIQNANLMQGKKIFAGHNRVIVLGEEFAKNGLNQALDFFNTNAFARKNLYLIIAKGKGLDIISTKINEGILPAEILEKMINNSKKAGYAENIMLYQFQSSLKNKHNSAIIPAIKKIEPPKEKSKSGGKSGESGGGEKSGESGSGEKIEPVSQVIIEGCGIISKDGLVNYLDNSETRGILWLRNEVRTTTVISKTDKFDIASVDIAKAKTKITPYVTSEKIRFDVEIKCSGALGELQIKDGTTVSTNDIKEIQKAVESDIEDECVKGFNKAVKENKSDIFNFGDIVWRENVDIWRQIKNDWENSLSDIELNITVNMDVDSVGLEYNQKE